MTDEPKLSERAIVRTEPNVGSLMARSALLGAPMSLRRPPDHLVMIEDERSYQGSSESEGNEAPPPATGPIKPPPFRRGVGPSRLVLWGDPSLEQVSERVTDFGEPLKQLVANLFGRLGGLHGYGLAAPQIGVNKAVAVIGMRLPEKPLDPLKIVMCNPVITKKGKKVRILEGCFSIPGFFHTIERRHSVTVTYRDETGEIKELKAKGLLAQVVQHEVDHLDGILLMAYVKERQARRRAERLVEDARKKG